MSNSKLYDLYSECSTQLSGENSRLVGKVLTLADSSFSDPQQRKAFKDIVRQIIESSFYMDGRDIIIRSFKKVADLNGEVLFEDTASMGSANS